MLRIAIAALVLAAIWLVVAWQTQVFPYYEARALYWRINPDAALAERNRDMSGLLPVDPANIDAGRRLVLLTYGQSNAANGGASGYAPTGQVFMVHDGMVYPYRDPVLGAGGQGGSVWSRVGDRLIEAGVADAVFIVATAENGAEMRRLAGGPDLDYMIAQYRDAERALGSVDAILYQQGEANHRNKLGHDRYARDFKAMIAALRSAGIEAPVYLAQASLCGDNAGDADLLAIQERLAKTQPGVRAGPDTDRIAARTDRLDDRCHFSASGYDRLAKAWADILTEDAPGLEAKAEDISDR